MGYSFRSSTAICIYLCMCVSIRRVKFCLMSTTDHLHSTDYRGDRPWRPVRYIYIYIYIYSGSIYVYIHIHTSINRNIYVYTYMYRGDRPWRQVHYNPNPNSPWINPNRTNLYRLSTAICMHVRTYVSIRRAKLCLTTDRSRSTARRGDRRWRQVHYYNV